MYAKTKNMAQVQKEMKAIARETLTRKIQGYLLIAVNITLAIVMCI